MFCSYICSGCSKKKLKPRKFLSFFFKKKTCKFLVWFQSILTKIKMVLTTNGRIKSPTQVGQPDKYPRLELLFHDCAWAYARVLPFLLFESPAPGPADAFPLRKSIHPNHSCACVT